MNILSLFPLPLLYPLAGLGYFVVYYIIPYRKGVVRENLTNAFPEKTKKEIIKIEKKYFKNLCNIVIEVVKMHHISMKELNKRVKFINMHLIRDELSNGRSVIACTGHYANWELCMQAMSMELPATNYVIYKPLSNPVFENWFYQIRTRFGNKFIPMRQTLRTVAATRNETTVFCFAADQTPVGSETHYWIDFLNQQTAVLLGMEKIAIQTGRPIFYFKTRLVKRGYYEVECIPLCLKPTETSGHEITDKQFALLADIIKEEPAYWLWSHRRWKHKPHNAG